VKGRILSIYLFMVALSLTCQMPFLASGNVLFNSTFKYTFMRGV